MGLALALVLYLAVTLILVRQGVPLGHDEALYATRARELLGGEPVSPWWAAYRAPGLPFFLTLAWLGEASEPYLRLVVTLFGAALVVFTSLLGRLMVGDRAATIAAIGVALSPVILMSSTQVWPDIPGAALGLGAMFFYARGLSSERPSWWLVVIVTGLVGLSTIVRFGAPIPITVGLVCLTFWRWPTNRRQLAFISACAVGVASVVAVVLLTPVISDGAIPINGISDRSSNNPMFGGFQDYWSMRERLYSVSTAIALAGVLIGVTLLTTVRSFRKRFVWPFIILLSTFVGIATLVHGELRYLSPVIPWLWISAGAAWASVASRIPKIVAWTAGAAAVVALALAAPASSDDAIQLNVGFQTIENAARHLAAAYKGTCGVFTSYAPQVEWYSGCETVVMNRHNLVLDSDLFPDGPSFLLFVEDGKRQPEGELFDEYLERTTLEPIEFHPLDPARRSVEIWEIRRP